MNKQTVSIGALILAVAGGATVFALARSLQHTPAPAAVVNTGRTVVDARDDDDDDEDIITLADLPAAVRTALANITGDDAVTQVARESERGTTTYDVEYTKDGKQWAIEFSADGAVLENEQDDDECDDD